MFEYTYNGLGHRIGWHYDADGDNDVDASDPWYYFAYDERWRMVATFRGASTAIEIFTNHCAGRGGYGGSSALDAVICRDKNLDDGWLGGLAENESLEERVYFCHNWRNDVVAVVSSSGHQRVSRRFSAPRKRNGVPFAAPAGDLDAIDSGGGDCDFGDLTIILGWIGPPGSYDVRGDLDLDGDVDAADQSTLTGTYSGVSLGRGKLSRGVDLPAGGIRKGYAGYEHDGALLNASFCHVRHRVYMAEIGRWTRRDPLGYIDHANTYEYARHSPLAQLDSLGLLPDYIAQRMSVLDENFIWIDCEQYQAGTCDRERCDRINAIKEVYKEWAGPHLTQLQALSREHQRRSDAANADLKACMQDANEAALACKAGTTGVALVTRICGRVGWPLVIGEWCILVVTCESLRLRLEGQCMRRHEGALRAIERWYQTETTPHREAVNRARQWRERRLQDSEDEYLRCINERGVGAGDP